MNLTANFKDQLYNSMAENIRRQVLEDTWRTSISMSHSGYYILEPEYTDNEIVDFRIVMVNNEASQQMDRTPEDLAGKLINVEFPINVTDGHFEAYKAAYLNQRPYNNQYEVPEGLPGAGKWVHEIRPTEEFVVIKNYRAENNDDLYEIKRLAIQERANALEKVIREAGHDLKTPLSVIKLSLYLANTVGQYDPVKRLKYQDQAREQLVTLENMLDEMVAVAKMTGDDVVYTKVGINSFLKATYKSLSSLVESKSKELVWHQGEAAKILVSVASMQRVMTNLITNAVTYTDDDGKITLSHWVDGDDVVISVKDNGIGIPEDQIDNVFDRFYRVDHTREADEGNSGLGLSIAQDIVASHAGEIAVESTVGEGTEFIVKLPVIKDEV